MSIDTLTGRLLMFRREVGFLHNRNEDVQNDVNEQAQEGVEIDLAPARSELTNVAKRVPNNVSIQQRE